MEQIQTRLATLKEEYEVGERQLRELIQREAVIRETLLRISGAIQVLEELLAGDGAPEVQTDPAAANAEPGPAVLRVP